jgi:hypothetical protein
LIIVWSAITNWSVMCEKINFIVWQGGNSKDCNWLFNIICPGRSSIEIEFQEQRQDIWGWKSE